ncbi:MAG: hypothetical protein KDC34_16980, partial [Saprospiraceae bacterium]|nr:hypothetical protein [Saprospiraceae bacterium]
SAYGTSVEISILYRKVFHKKPYFLHSDPPQAGSYSTKMQYAFSSTCTARQREQNSTRFQFPLRLIADCRFA